MNALKSTSLALPVVGLATLLASGSGSVDSPSPESPSTRSLSTEALSIEQAALGQHVALTGLAALGRGAAAQPGSNPLPLFIGADASSIANPFIQPQDPALAGGGRDQTQQFFDLVFGHWQTDSVVIGRLGADLLIGGPADDVMIGGPEHFNPSNRDKAYGLDGDDVFLWSPGDGSDLFEGGRGIDTLVFGLMGEVDLQTGQIVFRVSTDQQAGFVFLDPVTGLPAMDVTNSPGFCEIIDSTSSNNAAWELARLNADHLARFVLRGLADSFAAGQQTTDNGLRVTLTLKDVEYLVCADRDGGDIVAYDLTWAPARQIPLNQLPQMVRQIVR